MGKTKDVRAAVEKELGFDPRVDSSDITVVNIGGNVNLTGTVPSFPGTQLPAIPAGVGRRAAGRRGEDRGQQPGGGAAGKQLPR
jgi:hypothetical protein